ncbi:MAG: LPS-assembly protein LptD [Acidobacteria bacterium]|nr:LPS-assembly protein LptD [Acidobacteriota bacterium]
MSLSHKKRSTRHGRFARSCWLGACVLAIAGILTPAAWTQTTTDKKIPQASKTTPARARKRQPGVFELKAKQQRLEKKTSYFDGDVEILYQGIRLRADHVQYDSETQEASAQGHVQLDYETQHVEATEGTYNLQTRKGTFHNVHGLIRIERAPNPNVLLSPNPFSFEAKVVQRLDERTLILERAWVTVCEPGKEIWKFYTRKGTIKMRRTARLEQAVFKILNVPVLVLPVAVTSVGKNQRQSGFLVPTFGTSTREGFVLGESFYWAPKDWMDATIGAELLSRRGVRQMAEVRATPWENVRFAYTYQGVNDRGLRGAGGVRVPQGGHESRVELDAFLPHGWRAVADVNTLTSLTYRLAFAVTFDQAVKSEVRSTIFATNNFHGFSLNFSALNYKNFLSAQPETAVVLRTAPGARIGSVDQAPWQRLPIYFGFAAWVDAVHRSQPGLETPAAVQRSEVAPHVTIPLHFGPWLQATTTATARVTRYGSQLQGGSVSGNSLIRTTGEIEIDLRPVSIEKTFSAAAAQWKHVIEPEFKYRYVNGVNQFGHFLRFDESDTLTDTNEIEYGIQQRLYRKSSDGTIEEIVSWRVAQKHYFDPTFGGAIVPGQRNVFQALDSITPFAFADGARRFSPVVSDFRITPGKNYDAQVRVDWDTERGKMSAYGTLLKLKPYGDYFLTLAHFATRADPALQPISHQLRALVGYGELNRIGLNGSFGVSYDVRQRFVQNQLVQVSYNGGCCGVAFEFRRLALGPVRSENQYRVALLIANIGTFGNLRKQEKIF